jgi:hypothetical protein
MKIIKWIFQAFIITMLFVIAMELITLGQIPIDKIIE